MNVLYEALNNQMNSQYEAFNNQMNGQYEALNINSRMRNLYLEASSKSSCLQSGIVKFK